MSTPAANRDEIVAFLLERLDRFETTLASMRDAVMRMEQVPNAVNDHENRITALEASKHRAEGAALAGKLFWAVVVAVGGAAGFVAHYLIR